MIAKQKEQWIELCELVPNEATMRADYVWEASYETAILETDDKKLADYIRLAKQAIEKRVQELQMDHGGTPEERQAITDALGGLKVLRRELARRIPVTGSITA